MYHLRRKCGSIYKSYLELGNSYKDAVLWRTAKVDLGIYRSIISTHGLIQLDTIPLARGKGCGTDEADLTARLLKGDPGAHLNFLSRSGREWRRWHDEVELRSMGEERICLNHKKNGGAYVMNKACGGEEEGVRLSSLGGRGQRKRGKVR